MTVVEHIRFRWGRYCQPFSLHGRGPAPIVSGRITILHRGQAYVMAALRERILRVYEGQILDTVPFMLDLSHWFYHRLRLPWDLSCPYIEPDHELIGYHRKEEVGFYIANNAAFWSEEYPEDVSVTVRKEMRDGIPEILWEIATPLGTIRRVRRWNESSYSWPIVRWGIRDESDLRIFQYAMSNRTFHPHWDRYRAWADAIGECGVVYMPSGYSAVGMLMNLWMGVENTILAAFEQPEVMRGVVDSIHACQLDLIDLLAESPAEIIVMGDNFSSDIQPPHFFAEWSRDYYVEAIRRLHAAGKFVAVHIDGRLRGSIGMIRETGADCGDAITPGLAGDLTPEECREEAGDEFILSGGISPGLWLPDAREEEFIRAVMRWLELRKRSPRLIAAAGDQVPPGAVEDRMRIMRDLVEEQGRF